MAARKVSTWTDRDLTCGITRSTFQFYQFPLFPVTNSHQKNSAFALGMGREKVHNVVIKESEPRSPKSLGVR
jgi:hypothetical protein